MKASRVSTVIMMVLAFTLLIGSVAGATTAPEYYLTTQPTNEYVVNAMAYTPKSTNCYADINRLDAQDVLPANTHLVVLIENGVSSYVYSPVLKRAGWVSSSDIVKNGLYGDIGVVLSQTVTLRAAASRSSAALATLNNGEIMSILGSQSGWYYVRYTNPKTGASQDGFVGSDYVQTKPVFIITTALTNVYAMPYEGVKCVGQMPKHSTLLILGETQDYYAVNLRSASGFIRKADLYN